MKSRGRSVGAAAPAVADDVADSPLVLDRLARLDEALFELDHPTAAALLAGVGSARGDSPLSQLLEAATDALGLLATADVDRLRHCGMALHATTLPLPGVLTVAVEVLCKAGAYVEAGDCLLRLAMLGHDRTREFLERLPRTESIKFLPLVRHLYNGRSVANLYMLQTAKNLLPTQYRHTDVDLIYTRMLGLPGTPAIRLPIRGVLDYVSTGFRTRRTVFPAQRFRLCEPRRVGEAPQLTAELRGREMFYCVLDDATVSGRSSLIWMDGEALIDAQRDELRQVVPSLAIDPLVIRDHRDAVDALPAQVAGGERRFRRIPAGIHLMGWSTHFFGHWMSEYLPKLAAMLDDPQLDGVPILVDEGMPEQLHEALQLLVGDTRSIIRVPIWTSLQVRRLWWCANPMYVPILPRSGQNLDATHMSAPPQAFAALLDWLRQRYAAVVGPVERKRRLFLARGPGRRRKMLNRQRIEKMAEEHGFDIIHPEKYSFAEQLKLIREASHVVGPEGSGLMLAYFAEPGTRLCMLNHEFLENLPTMSGTLEALGVETSIIYGRCLRRDENLRYSDYEIEPAELQRLFDCWGLQPAPKASTPTGR